MKDEQGNVLFLILIAVALFAALSYAVTQSNRGGGNADDETNSIVMSQYTQIVADLRVTIQRMILSGTPTEDIKICDAGIGCFPAIGSGDYCSSGSNCVFAPEGGGFDKSRIDGVYGIIVYEYLGVVDIDGHNSSSQILFRFVTINRDGVFGAISLSECEAINKGYGISTMAKEQTGDNLIADGTILSGMWDFCYDGNTLPSNSYQAYSLLAKG